MLDIFIIGAGPHSLAAVSRLYEDTPSALYSDFEHARLHWLRKHAKPGKTDRIVPDDVAEGRASLPKKVKTPQTPQKVRSGTIESRPKVMVMDKQAARFMGTWDTFFDAFKIKHLRSPLFFHPHPGDLDALKSYAHANGRAKELIEIENVVGTEWSKHQKKVARIKGKAPQQPHINLRDNSDYYIPSSPLFKSFIQSEVIERYSLESIVRKGLVTNVKYHAHPDPSIEYTSESPSQSLDGSDSYFTIESSDGQVFHSRAVIMSIGPGGVPNVPEILSGGVPGVVEGEGWCHTAAFLKPGKTLPPKEDVRLTEKIISGKGGTLLVIGGGLTSVQIADLALSNGFKKVIFVARSYIKVKPFDVGIEWVGKYSNLLKMMFYQEDDPSARFDQFRTARNGGSVPAAYYKLLQSHVKSGKLDLRTQTTIQSLERDSETGTWSVKVEHRCLKKSTVKCPRTERVETRANGKASKRRGRRSRQWSEDTREAEMERERESDQASKDASQTVLPGCCEEGPMFEITRETLEDVDFIVSATGSKFDIEGLPFLRELNKDYPIQSIGGMPILTDDCQWRADVPFFCMGGYAGLQLGPGGGNLIGSREGAERVTNGLSTLFPRTWGEDAEWRLEVDEFGNKGVNWRAERAGNDGNVFDGLEEEIE